MVVPTSSGTGVTRLLDANYYQYNGIFVELMALITTILVIESWLWITHMILRWLKLALS